MATAEQVDEVLNIYSRKYVEFSAQEVKENQAIARAFVQQFAKFVKTKYGLTLKSVEEGSAFEELKVGKPDEFDFMLVIDHSDLFNHPTSNAKDSEIASMKKKQGQLKWLLNCYHRITLRGGELPAEIQAMVEYWPGTKDQSLSAQKTIKKFREYLQDFTQTSEANKIQGVSAVEPPKTDSSALTTILQKSDNIRSKISVHVSPALMFQNSKGGTEYYVAKKPVPALAGVDNAKLQLLWLESFSQAEMKVIQRKTTEERRNYRMVKRFFDEDVDNKYIWKTIFMKREKRFPSSPLSFLTEMLSAHERALYSEQDERKRDKEGRSKLPGGKSSDPDEEYLLLSRFNEYENVLATYSDDAIKNMVTGIQRYQCHLECDVYADFLLDKPEIGEICEACGQIGEIYREAKARREFQL